MTKGNFTMYHFEEVYRPNEIIEIIRKKCKCSNYNKVRTFFFSYYLLMRKTFNLEKYRKNIIRRKVKSGMGENLVREFLMV